MDAIYAERYFKTHPRLIASAEGHCSRSATDAETLTVCQAAGAVLSGIPIRIVEAICEQVGKFDYRPGFQLGHEAAFHLARPSRSICGAPI